MIQEPGIDMNNTVYNALDNERKELLDAAEKVMRNAYNPYSRFYVGAAIRCEDGEIITGANVENCAYGSTICAERMALGRANAKGKRYFKAIAIIGSGGAGNGERVVGPCGCCRQMIFEFSQISGEDIQVIMADSKKQNVTLSTIEELLPLSFGPSALGIDITSYQK